ncbi:MAG: lipid-binding SYLF domain-containing protein [Acidobacteriota bacterium]
MKLKLLVLLTLSCALLSAASDPAKRLKDASDALKDVMGVPDRSIPQELLAKAECVIIVPDLVKGAFFFGGQYGRGFAMCRKDGGVGWSAPASIRIEGGSFGLQIGASATNVFMLIMNKKGMDRLLTTKFTLGGEAAAAAGPVGRSSQAETDAAMTAEILTWSKSRGLFAGISLKGSTLRADKEWNRELYGKELENREIIMNGVAPPAAAADLLSELNRFSSRR